MSSLNSALSAAVSGLFAQSTSISAISTNLSNVGTTAYKEASVSFSTLVSGSTGNNRSSNFNGSGVYAGVNQSISHLGNVSDTAISTNIALTGSGFLVVSDDAAGDELYFSRVGSFYPDKDDKLVNLNGFYLQGYPTDASGNPTVGTGSTSTLETIDLGSIGGNAAATENIDIRANIPANAAIGDSFNTDIEMFDSLGTSHYVTATWTKTAANTWDITYADPVLSADSTTTTGTVTGSSTITFDSDGNFVSSTSNNLAINGWTTGASNSAITMNFAGLTQFTKDEQTLDIEIDKINQDGLEYGELKAVSIGSDGLVTATFENGTSYPVYQIPVATFSNPNGLALESGNVYSATNDSGTYTLHDPGDGGAGELKGSALEGSTVDTADQLTKLIVAQQAYSACAEIVSTTDDMFDTLISAAR
ncbi:flagellar hook protein FlgE [Aestuariispira insulae]|uniref:Flagellar hook protein FlgE n=1 Tax=Aestuariispira insulae TaxID=1461337 RepID=A0A3D9H5N6_9PROT|nr:flagellar hook protein FlgE [Aestuariispira insulae]RED44804.1 flagellar hook protein FlgE [Aestuariispira insulae]